jgi:hypothetical protein
VRTASDTDQVTALGGLTPYELRAEWRRRLKTKPPKLRSRELLAHALAYRLQVHVHGDLPLKLRREADLLARRFEDDRQFTPVAGPDLKVGSSVIRDWGGLRHEVAVTREGFAYQGQTFRSLSAVAQAITGVKWNGLVFFGLRERR